MLLVSVQKCDIPALTNSGVPVKINGRPETLTRDGDWLCYENNRCRIIDEWCDETVATFAAASHGDEDEPHSVISPVI